MVTICLTSVLNLEQHQKALLLIGCLPLPFDPATIMMITRFVASAVGKIYKLRTEKLRELEASLMDCQIIS